MRNLSLYIILFSLAACQKKEAGIEPITPKQLSYILKKVSDSIVSVPFEERMSYRYTAAGHCDTLIFEKQQTYPPVAPSWSYEWTRYVYTNDSLPLKVYKKSISLPEELYASYEYDAGGRIKKLVIYDDTIKFTYLANGRIERDSQFNRFGVWDYYRTYQYDGKGNVLEWKTFSRLSPNVGQVLFTYDDAINPLQKKWNLLPPNPESISPNNIISMQTGSPGSSMTITYEYNNSNLPVRAKRYFNTQPEPRIRTFYYQ